MMRSALAFLVALLVPPNWSGGVYSGHVAIGGGPPPLPPADHYIYLGASTPSWSVVSLDTTTGANTSDVTDPIGGNTAVKANDGFAGGAHEGYNNFNSGVIGGTHYCGVGYYQKGPLGNPQFGAIEMVASPTYRSRTVVFDLSTGAVTDTHDLGTPVSPSVQIVSIGAWWRVALCVDMGGGTDDYFLMQLSTSGTPTYDGGGAATYVAGGNFMYLWSQP